MNQKDRQQPAEARTKKSGTVDALFAHWILGEGASETGSRWSIVHDVLGWM